MTPKRTLDLDHELDADLLKDRAGVVHAILHIRRPVAHQGSDALEAAVDYLRSHASLLGVTESELRNLGHGPDEGPAVTGLEYRFFSKKPQCDVTTITFMLVGGSASTLDGGMSVHVKRMPDRFAVLCAQIFQPKQQARLAPLVEKLGMLESAQGAFVDTRMMRPGHLGPQELALLLGVTDTESGYDPESVKILRQSLVFYRYQAAKRFCVVRDRSSPDLADALSIRLPDLPQEIEEDDQYLATAVYFELAPLGRRPLEWLAIVEVDTGAIMHLEPLVGAIDGKVFVTDPMTSHGGPAPESDNEELDQRRTSVRLEGLDESAGQVSLIGDNVQIDDFDPPLHNPPPTKPQGQSFDFHARTNDFAAVNAYYHCDRFIRLVEDLGFVREEYFSGTRFPLFVDPRGVPPQSTMVDGNIVNAQCVGTTEFAPAGSMIQGIRSLIFGLAEKRNVDEPIGNASDWRVVLHELAGHGILFNHVGSSTFDFGHTAGDGLAAILNDPGSRAPDPHVTFPWTRYEERRHDRRVAAGWGWDGAKDENDRDPFLKREQILATTHFRLYQALGGADQQLPVQLFAARLTTYLILRAVQTLTPLTNPKHASDWLCSLLVADAADWDREGHAGGAYEKVIRWAFEKQNLFGGSPPEVDVFIDDGRGGKYQNQPNLACCPSVWNRREADRVDAHQAPGPGVNFAYVRVRNRGKAAAEGIVVAAFKSKPQSRLVYPDDWDAMTPPRRTADDPLLPGQEIIVGPFAWTPSAGDNYILMAVSADGDPSNLAKFGAGKSIPDWRLVPHDNNLGMRKA